ncbi:MAG: hypothetical protein KGL39_01875 [Patescibacteria group bacterium]|nr:hypothetical protein [Patescibacteria group bacterium]
MSRVSSFPNVEALVSAALSGRDDRSTQILRERYGLRNPDLRTLEEIGGNLDLTRERVRQIEAKALEAARADLEEAAEARLFLELVHAYLNGVGNLRRDDLLAADLRRLWQSKQKEEIFRNYLRFLTKVLDGPQVVYETSESHAYWHNDRGAEVVAKKLVVKLHSHAKEDFDSFLEATGKKFELPEPLVVNYLLISKSFMIGPYGDLGSGEWLHINPKTVRDKTYLVLQRAGRPLHFEEIAKEVNRIGAGRRSAATVHNELIRDRRFILVKRGIYTIKS